MVERDPTERECAEFAESASAGLAKVRETEPTRRRPVVDEYLAEPAAPEPDRVPWVWQRVFGVE